MRRHYQGHCGYCGVSEDDAGGQLTVDHYVPTIVGGSDDEENLVYCCFRCDLYKGNFSPTPADRTEGFFVLHPKRDPFHKHLQLDESTGLLEPISVTGRFHLTLLHLNRPELVTHRLWRRALELREARLQLLEAEISELRVIIAAQEIYVAHLRRLIDEEIDG